MGNQNCGCHSPIWEPTVWVMVQAAWGFPTPLEVSTRTDLCCSSILLMPLVHLVDLYGSATHLFANSFTGAWSYTLFLCNGTQLCTSILAQQSHFKTSASSSPASPDLSFPLQLSIPTSSPLSFLLFFNTRLVWSCIGYLNLPLIFMYVFVSDSNWPYVTCMNKSFITFCLSYIV